MMRKREKKKEEGFTLIEVLVTMVILSGVLTALLSCFIYGLSIISRMKQTAIATQIIQEQLEDIRDKTYDEIVSLGTSFENTRLDQLSTQSGCEEASGGVVVESSEGDDIKKITVTVQWTYRGRAQREDLVTFITREGINKK
ncbi:MAG: type II secretion system protein [Candidatus Aminicenantes bacterium]|nr:type II secretion system protein [Candidatus Aminicenantes bacterium]